MIRKNQTDSFKNIVFNKVQKILGFEEKKKDTWAENLFSDLERLGGRVVLMKMG
jgi:hypothetical protein